MPALALPLLIPFAEAAGIALGAITTGIGLKTLSDKVEDYIEDNPENAQKIFAMIMPEQGIANILKNKSSEGDEEVSETETEEVEEKPKLSGREKGMRIKEAIRRARGGKGNYSSPDAEGPAVDIRGSVIREVEDMGIADPDLKDNYKPSGYTGWKRFANKGKKKYANGGGIGSMMQPKKKTNKAVDLLQAKAPEGEFLAYINQGEAKALKDSGGSGHLVNGIPSFVGSDYGNSGYQGGMRGNSGYQGSKGGDNISNNNNNGPDRSYVTAQQQANHVAAQAAAKEAMEKATRRKEILSKINPITGIYSLLNKNPLSMLGSMFGKGFKGLAGKMRGINPETGLPNTQAEYEQNRYDRQQIGRLDNLYAAKDKGYNSLFGMKTNDFTPGQQSKIDSLERNYDPTTARNVDSGRGSGLRNTVAANNITNNNMKSELFDPNNIQSLINNAASKNTQPQGLSMMEQYYNDIDKRATGPNTVQDASTLAQQIGLNKEQTSYLDNLNNRNKQVGNTGYTDNFKSLRNPSNQAGAFFSYESPQDVIDSVMSLNSKSTPFYNSSVDPSKITYGDTKTFAQPNEITSYIESLSPKDRTYSFGVSENDPNNNYLELANGGLASMFIRGR